MRGSAYLVQFEPGPRDADEEHEHHELPDTASPRHPQLHLDQQHDRCQRQQRHQLGIVIVRLRYGVQHRFQVRSGKEHPS